MAFSNVGAVLFGLRNGYQTSSGDLGRYPVTFAQGATSVKAFAQMNNSASRSVNYVLKTFEDIAKGDKFFSGLCKATEFASANVNKLIVASSIIKTARADGDKRKDVAIGEVGNLAGMFLGEGWMKRNLNTYLEILPVNKKYIPVIRGITFVAGSLTASTLGRKIVTAANEKYKAYKAVQNNALTQSEPNEKSTELKRMSIIA